MSFNVWEIVPRDELRRLREKQLLTYDKEVRGAANAADDALETLFTDDERDPYARIDEYHKDDYLRRLLLNRAKSSKTPAAAPPAAAPPRPSMAAAAPPPPTPSPPPPPTTQPRRSDPLTPRSRIPQPIVRLARNRLDDSADVERLGERIVDSMPQDNRRAQMKQVVDHILKSEKINFDGAGNVYVGGEQLRGAKIEPLLKSMMFSGRTPKQMDAFAAALATDGLDPSLVRTHMFSVPFTRALDIEDVPGRTPTLRSQARVKAEAGPSSTKNEQRASGFRFAAPAHLLLNRKRKKPMPQVLKLYK